MNWWVEKKRSKTGKSGLKKMAKNGQKLRKIAKNIEKMAIFFVKYLKYGPRPARARARVRVRACAPLHYYNYLKKNEKRKDGIFGLVRGFKQIKCIHARKCRGNRGEIGLPSKHKNGVVTTIILLYVLSCVPLRVFCYTFWHVFRCVFFGISFVICFVICFVVLIFSINF